jgi:hypothetical protein
MFRHVALVRTDGLDEHIASIIGVTRIGELGTLAVTSNRSTLRRNTMFSVVPSSPILVTMMMEAIRSSETSVLTKATRHYIPEVDTHDVDQVTEALGSNSFLKSVMSDTEQVSRNDGFQIISDISDE